MRRRIGLPTVGLATIVRGDFASAEIFDLVAGEVVVTGVDADRMQGTFTATFASLELPLWEVSDTVVVTDGRFDVPIVSAWR